MNPQILFLPLTKVDAKERLVYGIASAEELDKSNEIFDYETSKPLIKEWSDAINKASGGKSLGNVRGMHQKNAAGILTQLEMNDSTKAVEVCCKVVDDAEWAKVESGVYTGFSFGGSYAKRWVDEKNPNAKRYTAKPSELSLVDNPCVPSATFSMVKADGTVEQKPFAQPALPGERQMKKGMYGVQSLASAIASLEYCRDNARYEAQLEGDSSQVPKRLNEAIKILGEILVDMAREEVDESTEAMKFAKALDETIEQLSKVGAKYSKETKQKMQTIHDHIVSMGAACENPETEKAMQNAELQKIATATGKTVAEIEAMLKAEVPAAPAPAVVPASDALAKTVEALQKSLEAQAKELELLKAQPAAPAGALPAVALSKTDDAAEKLAEIAKAQLSGQALVKVTDEASALVLMKKAFQNGEPVTQEMAATGKFLAIR